MEPSNERAGSQEEKPQISKRGLRSLHFVFDRSDAGMRFQAPRLRLRLS